MTCDECKKRGKKWQGSDSACAFVRGAFHAENYNCASVNLLRELVYDGKSPMPSGVDYRYCEDQKYATVQVDHVEGVGGALALWVTWYKNRGSTDGAWLLFSDQPPRPPTEYELMAIVHHYISSAGIQPSELSEDRLECDHTIGVSVCDDGGFLQESEFSSETDRLRIEFEQWKKNPSAIKFIVEKMNNYSGLELIANKYTLFNYCPDCGARLTSQRGRGL